MKLERFFEMPNKHTFQMPKLRQWFLQWLKGRVLNVFAGETKLTEYPNEIVYNDINPNLEVDFHYDAMEISKFFTEESFDSVILDPPYTHEQAIRMYQGRMIKDLTRVKNEVHKLLKPGGIVVSFAFNSTGMGKKRGYEKLAVLIVNGGAGHNDIIVTVERKIQRKLLEEREKQ